MSLPNRPEELEDLALLENKPHIHAWAARSRAYAPYSHYLVGACVVTKAGKMYRGANVENSSYGLTICAERNALVQYILNADQSDELSELWFATNTPLEHSLPCGACMQFLSEFCTDKNVKIGHFNGVDCKTWKWSELKRYFGKVSV